MKFALKIADNSLLSADQGNYEIARQKICVCPHCRNPVYWRSQTSYFSGKLNRQVGLGATWVHYPGADKDCPLYTGSDQKKVDPVLRTTASAKGQREKLLLKRFWEIMTLGLNLPQIEDRYSQVIDILQQKFTPSPTDLTFRNFGKTPLPVNQIALRYVMAYLDVIADRLYQQRLNLYVLIPEFEKEVLEFLFIDKNREFLHKVIALLIDLEQEDLKKQSVAVASRLTDKLQQEIFKEAFLLTNNSTNTKSN